MTSNEAYNLRQLAVRAIERAETELVAAQDLLDQIENERRGSAEGTDIRRARSHAAASREALTYVIARGP